MPNEQRIVHFSGMVQGVGFRYTACRVAGGYDVTGYVRNLPDGTVECLVEGHDSEIDAFLRELSASMSGHITDRTQQVGVFTGRYGSFGVKY